MGPLDFDLPAVPAAAVSGWQRWIDTALESPEDIVEPDAAPLVPGAHYRVMARSVALLFLRIAAQRSRLIHIKDALLHVEDEGSSWLRFT